jgi:hypothetical protein
MQCQLPSAPTKKVNFVILKSLHEYRLDLAIFRRRYPLYSQHSLLLKGCNRGNRQLYDHLRDHMEV